MEKSKPWVILKTLLIAYILTGILLIVLALGLYQFHLNENQISIGINVIYIITCLVGGMIAGKIVKHQRFIWGLLTGLSYFLILLAVSFLVNKGLGGSLKEILLVMGICTASGTLGGMIS